MSVLGPLGDVGQCQIYFGAAITSVKEGATFRFSQGYSPVKDAENGNAEVDGVLTGVELVEFECPLTRITYANLSRLIPGSSYSGATTSGGIIARTLGIVGTTMYANATELIVKRLVAGVVDTDKSKWLHIPKAYPIPQFDVPYTIDGQRGFMVLFKGFPDPTTGVVWHIGEATGM